MEYYIPYYLTVIVWVFFKPWKKNYWHFSGFYLLLLVFVFWAEISCLCFSPGFDKIIDKFGATILILMLLVNLRSDLKVKDWLMSIPLLLQDKTNDAQDTSLFHAVLFFCLCLIVLLKVL